MKKRIYIFLIAAITFLPNNQANNYQMFDNYKPGVEAISVRFFIQGPLKLMWIGTNKGLYSFDGYTAYPHYTPGSKNNSTINCGVQINDEYLLLGFETGPLLYNIRNDKYEPFIPGFENDVRSLAKTENKLWIGCTSGLYVYDLQSGILEELFLDTRQKIKHNMVYALLKDDGYMYLGSNSNFGRYSLDNNKYESLGVSASSNNFFVTSILKDNIRNCIWIGRGFSLLKYFPNSGDFENVGEYNVVKSMALDHENNVIMGTDNGLLIYMETDIKYIVHDSRETKSLPNNIVWCVYKDPLENIWLGTDNGISLSPKKRNLKYYPIYKITGTGEGNQFNSIIRDSLNNYWLGGTNGLLRCKNNFKSSTETPWYKMGESKYHISHNHIRDIYEDKDHNLWVATDYGLNRYDHQSEQFIRYSIFAPNGIQNVNWTYDLLEDKFNRIWVATFKDGIFVVDKKSLLSGGTTHIANHHFSTDNGMSGNNIFQIVADKAGNMWSLIYKSAIDVINVNTGEISNFPIKDYTNGIIPSYIINDSQGFIWAGYRNGILRINPVTKNVVNISLNGKYNAEVLAMTEVEESIWISTTDGIWIIDKNEFSKKHINPVNYIFTGIYYDEVNSTILLGSSDGIALYNPDATNELKSDRIIISAIYINNQHYTSKKNTPSVRYIDEIKLAHNQNNIRIEFSDLIYIEENRESFIYKLEDENEWHALTSNENKVELNKLEPGTYNLIISKMTDKGEPSVSVKKLSIIITPPWHGTLLAKIIYSLLILTFSWWIYFFITAKNRMRYERKEKETSLEQSKLKIAFFSNVAHEFKTPLSLIIAPLNGLIQGTKNEKDRNALEMVHQNAMKLNSLIHQAIDYYRNDSKVNIGLLLSKIELIEFARSIFLAYKEGMKDKHIDFIFNTNVDRVYLNLDTVKIESVFNNLLTNACKFTNSGDSIILSIEYFSEDNEVEIKVSDTGLGIPSQDLPYVFQRFFQSSENSDEREGTGIGLFLVKNYVELHGGDVKVMSKVGEGATFTVVLPAMVAEMDEIYTHEKSVSGNENKQLIVVVEDNIAIAEFIYNTFISEYRCVIAHNGKTGLKACKELKPDIIIADVMMPVMDGFEMAHRLKEDALTATIPLVFLTAKDDKETELKSIQLNIEAFIAKPFDSSILYSRVKQILENRDLLAKKVRIEQLATPKIEKVESIDEKFLAKITKTIENKIDDPELNVNMLCELVDISSKQLYRKVKQLTGMTAIEYIKSIRMKKAAMFLSNKNFTIAEVMYMVGFSNHSYFAKCFQSRFGKSPRQFIEDRKKDLEN